MIEKIYVINEKVWKEAIDKMEDLYVIENIRHGTDCCIFWRKNGEGYTRDFNDAWRVTKEKAKDICKGRPEQDRPRSLSELNLLAVRHIPR